MPFIRLGDKVFTRFSAHCLLWPWHLTYWPNQYAPGPDTYITQFWWN